METLSATNGFKFDVAFSFLYQDETLALELNELIKDRLATFIYTEKQKSLVGRDGEDAFSQVYGRDARLVVVLYRGGWGDTKWTSVEMTAIKNRSFLQRYEKFLMVLRLDEGSSVPEYIPRTILWGDLQRLKVTGAVGAIEERVRALGAEVRQETPIDRAKRMKRKMAAEEARRRLLDSEAGVIAARDEVAVLTQAVRDLTSRINLEAGVSLSVAQARMDGVSVFGSWKQVEVIWFGRCSNTLRGSRLRVRIWPAKGTIWGGQQEPDIDMEYEFTTDDSGEHRWLDGAGQTPIASSIVAERCLHLLIDNDRRPAEEDESW